MQNSTEVAYRRVLADLLRVCDPLGTMKPGDTVRLKSGGPTMTIREVDEELIVCDWFEGSKAQEKSFHVSQLIPIANPTDSNRPQPS